MSQQSSGGWHPDPYGRFTQRWYDGAQWTEHVVDAAGNRGTDPPTGRPSSPSTTSTPATTATPTGPVVLQPGRAAATSVGPGLILTLAGAVAVVLSVLVLEWYGSGGEGVTRADLSDFVGTSSVDVQSVSEWYLEWGWIAGLAAVGLAVVGTFVRNLRPAAILACLVAAGWHGYFVFDGGTDFAQFGLYLGPGGYVVAALGAGIAKPAP